MKLHSLLAHVPFAKQLNNNANPEILSIEQDTRNVKEGSLFICIEGSRFDGHQFAQDAVKKGAVAIISNRPLENIDVPVVVVNDTNRAMAVLADIFYKKPSQQLFLVGITGTNGKTSVSHLVDHLFKTAQHKTGVIGTLYTKIGNDTYETINTTPDSITLQKTFKQMVDRNVTIVSMEVSSHALVQGRVWGCDFDVAVFTNLSQDHLDFHKTMEEYKKAKSLLFSQLGNRYDEQNKKFAILNADDQVSAELKIVTSAHVLTYGIEQKCDVRAENIVYTSHGTMFDVVTPVGKTSVSTNLIGKFNVYNVLSAIAVGLAAQIPLETIAESLATFTGVPGRFELVKIKEAQDCTVIVDYAHTPDGLENVLQTVQSLVKDGNIYVVVGCGGDRDRTKRPLMAQIACQYATHPIFTSDNPRTEDPIQILQDMEAGVKGLSYQVIPDRKEAIFQAVMNAKTNDFVLIAGKGHEDYQIIGTEKIHFDDREVAKEALYEKQTKTLNKNQNQQYLQQDN